MAKANDERGVSPVIATILMVAITVVLAAVLYVMVTSIITQPLIQKPQVVLDNGSCTTTDCSGRVATASPATDLAQFRVTVAADGAVAIPPTTLAANVDIAGSGVTFRYRDVGAEGKMTGGDTFLLRGIAEGVSYEVTFLWADGSVVASMSLRA